MGSSFKGKVAGLPAGDGRYLKNCRFEETKGWVKPAECEKRAVARMEGQQEVEGPAGGGGPAVEVEGEAGGEGRKAPTPKPLRQNTHPKP